jgi:hypothetical protein
LDDRVIAQLPVRAGQPDNAARIRLPASTLRPGFRVLGFRAAQHYTNECEDPSAPELFSQVDAVQSILELRAPRRPITPSLARLGEIFDRRLWLDRYPLQLFLPGAASGDVDDDMLSAAAQVVQGIGAIFDFLPVGVQVRPLVRSSEVTTGASRRFPGIQADGGSWDGVIVGTRDQLASFVHPDLLRRITGGFLGVYRYDEDPTRAMLVVSGTTPDEVLQAATLLNLPGVGLPDRQEVVISSVRVPVEAQRRRVVIDEPGWTSFANLGFTGATLRGRYPQPAQIEFWFNREMLKPGKGFVKLEISLAYGVGFDRKSGLNILLNGQFLKAIPLQNVQGEQIYRYQVELPTLAFREGKNLLQLQPTLIGVDLGGACVPIFYDNLWVAILPEGRLELPDSEDYLTFPNLAQLANLGLPYTRTVTGADSTVLITEKTPQTVGSALTLLGKLRQVSRAPLAHIRVTTNPSEVVRGNGLIAVGPESSLPERLRKEMQAFSTSQTWQSVVIGQERRKDLASGLQRWKELPTQPLLQLISIAEHVRATIGLREGLGESAAIVQFFSSSADTPVTVLTAHDGERLSRGVDRLVEHAVWTGLDGAGMLWTPDGEVVVKAAADRPRFIGEEPAVSWVSRLLSDRPWFALILWLLGIGAMASVSWWLLRRRAQQRLKSATPHTDG